MLRQGALDPGRGRPEEGRCVTKPEDMRLERHVDESWGKLDTDWPEFISIWWTGAGEVALWQVIFSQNGHFNNPDSICSSRLKQKVESNFPPSQKAVF